MQADAQGHEAPHPDIHMLHQQLVDKVKAAGYITSPRVEEAFRAVPRHLFLPLIPPTEVYQDRPIMTKMLDGQYVSSSSQPTIMAIMLEQLDLQSGQRVLEIGAGTGYNAALMAHIVGETGQVVTIDIDDDIVEGARIHLIAAGYGRVQVICADGGLGYPDAAPFDRIILTVGASDITLAWREQLKTNGRLLLPLLVRVSQLAIAFESRPDTDYWQSISVRACGFVGLRGAFAEDGETIQLAPAPAQVLLGLGTPHAVQAEHVLSLLQGSYRDLPVQISVTPADIYWSLNYWLAIHEPLICNFFALGEAAHNGILPGLAPSTHSTIQSMRAIGLLSNTALALVYPLHEATPSTEASATSTPAPLSGQAEQTGQPATPHLSLYVRSYGDDDTLAHHLIEQIRAWDETGRPDVQRLHIRSYTRDNRNDDILGEGDILIERRWSRFVFNWQL
ncbi:MAG TPA: hypothetical protein DHW02_21260 [Ktedonobacter sp.]|nr:hypothetical protein [Ktedonobacter sp.]